MKPTKPTKGLRGARATRQLPYQIEMTRTPYGSQILQVRYLGDWRDLNERQRNIFIHLLAAELEERSEAVGARWVVAAEVYNARITIEIADDDEAGPAWDFASKTIEELHLAE